VFVAVPLTGILGLFGTLYYVYAHLKLPDTPPPLQTTYIYDRSGNQIGVLHASVDRTIIPLSDIPLSLQHAVIATEDQHFYSNPGFDPIGIVRAAWDDLIAHKAVQGASTITQQLVKNEYAGTYVTDPTTHETHYVVPPRTVSQKVREVLLAIKLNQTYTKDEILAKYLNTVYLGHGAYGVQAAAQTYWGIDAKDLTPLESATLAGVIAAPSTFDPAVNPIDSQIRRNFVLDRMAAEGYLTADRAAQLKSKKVRTSTTDATQAAPPKLGYYLDYTKRALIAKYTEATVFGGGLKVTTGLDQRWQGYAEQAVRGILHSPGDPAAALVAIDPSTGEVRAMYGGKDFTKSQVNLATGDGGSGRQTGSAFKVFTLTAAMLDHFSLQSIWNGPGTITIQDPLCFTNGGPWTLSNASDSEAGIFTLAQATAHSVNTIFAQLVTAVGPDKVAEVAHDMGIRSPLHAPGYPPPCSITLGVEAVNPLEMTNAYATLAANGVRRWATPIHSVTDASGQVIPQTGSKGKQVIPANDAALVTSALQGVISGGTGYPNALLSGWHPAGKTGTAQNYVDAWFCGYVPQLATCVWVGYPKNDTTPLTNVEGYSAVYGGTIPARIWHDFMVQAIAHMQPKDFPTPSTAGYTVGPPTPAPIPAPSPSKSPKPSPSPSPSLSPTPSPSPSPTPTPTPSPSPSPTPTPSPSPSPTSPPPTPAPARRRLLAGAAIGSSARPR
jgi:penicillin-binding protein 1A